MARTRYVHRTLLTTECEVMTVNPSSKEIGSVVVSVQGSYEEINAKLEKEVKKGFDALSLDDVKMVSITNTNIVTKEYRMLESLFMSLAESTIVDGESIIEDDEEVAEDEEDGEE